MKLLLQRDDKSIVEVKEIEGLNKDSEMLFFFLNCLMRPEDIKNLEILLSKKIGRKVVILDAAFKEKALSI